MIITNGYIKPKIKTGGGFDDDGNPIPSGSTWGNPIPCRHKPNRNSFKGKSNGNTFIVAAWEIYIEPQPFTTEQIQIFNEDDSKIGEYSIMWVENLDAVEAIKITV